MNLRRIINIMTINPLEKLGEWLKEERSGMKIDTLQELRIQQDRLSSTAEENRPLSFIGYTFKLIQRICFYSVAAQDFATCEIYEFNPVTQSWIYSLRVP
jgi:hypothetical protein